MGNFRREKRNNFREREFDRFKPFDNSRKGSRDFNRRNNTEMHTVVCDKCGQECQVPFRPTAGKPVYCDACFRNKDDFEPRGRQPPSSGSSDMKEINKKLDKIISILEKFEVVDE